MSPEARLEQHFPRLLSSPYAVTSAATSDYNCIAWAAGEVGAWWEPDEAGRFYWPQSADRDYSLTAYVAAFESIGYCPCADGDYVLSLEKVALFAREGIPTHASRQLAENRWTSKCGKLHDIEHELTALEGDVYGHVAMFLARPRDRVAGVPTQASES